MSGTCSWIRALTRRSRKYINTTQLNLMRGNEEKNLTMGLLASKKMSWKRIKLEVDGWTKKEMKLIKTLLGSRTVESLELHSTNNPLLSRSDKTLCLHSVADLIRLPHNLKSLAFEIGFLGRFFYSKYARSLEIAKNLSSLESLTILPNPNNKSLNLFGSGAAFRSQFHSNPIFLSTVSRMRLKSFEYLVQSSEANCFYEPIMEIVERNQSTLENLSLFGDTWFLAQEKLKILVFPELKSISVHTTAASAKIVANFIENQPLLQSIKITLTGILDSLELPSAIQRRSLNLR